MHQLFKILIILFFCFVAAPIQLQAQNNIDMNIETNNAAYKHLIDQTIALKNHTENNFEGTLKIQTPKGFKNITGSEIKIQLKANEQLFIPLKILKGKEILAGKSEIIINLYNKVNEIIATKIIEEVVEENNAMSLQAVLPNIYLTNVNDSLAVKVQVSNLGNKPQQVFVVFSIPKLTSENNFFEQTAKVNIHKDTVFTYKIKPTKQLLEQSQFVVNVAAMRSTEKLLFGNVSIVVQNVSSVKQYEDILSTANAVYHQKNSITTSFKTNGNNSNVYQLLGSGDIDLPAGYITLNTNIYQTENQNVPLISNTFLEYHLENQDIKIGNLNQPLELPLFGRGIQYELLTNNLSNRFQVGFIDENYNLIEPNTFLKRSYGMFGIATLGINNATNQKNINYVFKKDVYENVTHQMLGFEKTKLYNNKWNLRLKAHGGYSFYEKLATYKPSFAIETQYNGEINNFRLNGNYYISSSYFPGNRRGVIQFQQNILKNLKRDKLWFTNFNYSEYNPNSLTYLLNLKTTNLRVDSGISFPKLKFVGKTLGLQYYKESGNNFNWIVANGLLNIQAVRFTNNFNWQSKNLKHSVILAVEEGLGKTSLSAKAYPHFKINSIYSFKGFNAGAAYQYGSFFISEYTSLLVANKNQSDFKRLTVTVTSDQKFFENKLLIRSGASFISDFISGKTPSAFLNTSYTSTTNYRFFLNTSWFKNSNTTFLQTNHMFLIEAGLNAQLGGKAASAGKKGTLQTIVFYDKNSNNILDENDEIAPDVFVTVDKTTFKTDEKGEILYKKIPFGTYQIQPIVQSGWFTDAFSVDINSYTTTIALPLHQNGTLKGKISYSYDEKLVKNFDFKTGGIVFNITKNGQFVQRVATNDEGLFIAFLPTGTYEIKIDAKSLPDNTFCNNQNQPVKIQSGKITNVPEFVIQVQQKNIKVKKFGS